MLEQGDQPFDFAGRIFVSFFWVGKIIENSVHQNNQRLRHAIKNQQLIRDKKIHDWSLEFVVSGARNDRFDIMDEFVADEAHRSAREAGQTRHRDRPVFSHHTFHDLQPIANGSSAVATDRVRFHHFPIFKHLDFIMLLANDGPRVASDKGITAKMLAAFH